MGVRQSNAHQFSEFPRAHQGCSILFDGTDTVVIGRSVRDQTFICYFDPLEEAGDRAAGSLDPLVRSADKDHGAGALAREAFDEAVIGLGA